MNYGIIPPLVLRRYSCKITDWESLGGKWPDGIDGNDLKVARNKDGRLEVFMVGNESSLSQMAEKARW